MNRERVLAKLESAWSDFKQSYAGLADAHLVIPGVTGNWSVRDLICHVSVWEEEALKMLPLALAGRRPPTYRAQYGGIDAFNALMTQKFRDLSLDEVRAKLDSTHRRLVEYLRSIPEEQFATETRFRRRLRLDTYSHYPKHTQAIQNWRSKQESTPARAGQEF